MIIPLLGTKEIAPMVAPTSQMDFAPFPKWKRAQEGHHRPYLEASKQKYYNFIIRSLTK
jgi:hypothetical protein